jgi:DNA-directed RNA polymerase omega subunit
MKLTTMEKALNVYPNRFHLTMMAVGRAREINDGDNPMVELDDLAKPVVVALEEISRGIVVPAPQEEMNRIRSARKVLREKAMIEAREREALLEAEEAPEMESAQSEVSEDA